MKETKKTRLTGYFSVREYQPNVPLKEQRILEEGKQIAFISSLDAEPREGEPAEFAELRAEGTPYEYNTNQGAFVKKVRVKIKIGKFCEWYKEKPQNADLDGKRFEAYIQYVKKDKNPSKPLAASGLWANAIAIREVKQSSFDSDPFGEGELERLAPVVPASCPQMVEQPKQEEEKSGDLPF